MVNIHSHIPDATADKICLQVYPYDVSNLRYTDSRTVFSLGIHPWTVNASSHLHVEKMEEMLMHPEDEKIKAIGECGLDRLKNAAEFTQQKTVFCAQIRLANKYQLPLILHCVKAHTEVETLLVQEKNNMPVLFHGVSGKKAIGEQLIRKGYFFSFGKSLLNDNPSTIACFRSLPLEQIFLETDDADTGIKAVYEKAAALLGLSLSELDTLIKQNYNKFFAL